MLDEPRRILRRAHRNDQNANPWVAALAAPLVRVANRCASPTLKLHKLDSSTKCVDAVQLQRGSRIDNQVTTSTPTTVATTTTVAEYRNVANGDFTRSPQYPAFANQAAAPRRPPQRSPKPE
jgi:hypothetical protein